MNTTIGKYVLVLPYFFVMSLFVIVVCAYALIKLLVTVIWFIVLTVCYYAERALHKLSD
jgi:hypothetical protein